MPSVIDQYTKEATKMSRYYLNLGKPWIRTAGFWAAGAGLVGLYLTDWKAVLGYVPFIKDKYDFKPPK